MIRMPTPAEWDTSQLSADRRAYLDGGMRFEGLVARLLSEMEILRATVEHYHDPARGEPGDARQVVFVIRASNETCDLFYSAADGLRGRYWQSPDHGFVATRHMIEALSPSLISFARQAPPTVSAKATPMTSEDIRTSLEAPSAKVWPRERDNGEWLLVPDNLMVARWCQNEQLAEASNGMWRQRPRGRDLEIKGAIIGRDGTEYLPERKRDRSFQIHRFGFT